MAGDPFTAAIFRWLDRVAADPELPPAAFRLGYVISQHINRTSHQAWPSQETLRDAIGLKGEDGRSVRRLTTALAERGYLLMRRGQRVSMTYKLALDRSELSYQADSEDNQGGAARPDENDRSENQDRTFLTARPDNPDRLDRTNLTAKPLIEPLKEPGSGKARTRATLIPDDFELSTETHNAALAKLRSDQALSALFARFVNHYRSVDGPTAKQRDWQARFLLWVDDELAKPSRGRGVIEKIRSFDAGSRDIADAEWDDMASTFAKFDLWNSRGVYGPPPSDPGCIMPERFFVKHKIQKAAAA